MEMFNPTNLAIKMTELNEEEKEKNSSSKFNSEVIVLWDDESSINMTLPVDGWNARYWRRYFAIKYKLIYGHVYTGSLYADRSALSKFIFRCRNELKMNNYEIKDYIDWIAESRMKLAKNNGENYFVAKLLYHLSEYYNSYIFKAKKTDENAGIKTRHLCIDPHDLREGISQNIQKDVLGQIISIEPRLYVQLGIPIMVQYLYLQKRMKMIDAIKIVFKDIKDIIKEDIAVFDQSVASQSPRLKTIILNSILWEPYSWSAFDWRDSKIKELISFFKYDKEVWWKEAMPLGLKPAACLKILTIRKLK